MPEKWWVKWRRLLCRVGWHSWWTLYEQGTRIDQLCHLCPKARHSVYDMMGHSVWQPGRYWSKPKNQVRKDNLRILEGA